MFRHALVASLMLSVAACGDDGDAVPDASSAPDGSPADAPPSIDATSVDAPTDATGDAAVDATSDAPVDATGDAPVDATGDAAVDATADARPDAAVDAAADATIDAAVDGGAPLPCTASGGTIFGDFRIRSAADLPGLAGIGTITGTLFIETTALAAITLPDLDRVVIDVQVTAGASTTTIALPSLCEVGGDVLLQGAVLTSVDLGALGSVGGQVLADSPALTTLGLGALRTVGDDLRVRGADVTALTLPSVTSVGGDLVVDDDDLLTSLTAPQLITVGGTLAFTGNAALGSLAGLGSLTSLGGLQVASSPALTSLAALAVPASTGSVRITGNPVLTSLGALSALTAVTGVVTLDDNDALASLAGLDNLTSTGALTIRGHAALTSIAALDGLVTAGGLRVENNPVLTAIVLPALTAVNGALSITDNPRLVDLATEALVTLATSGEVLDNVLLPDCDAQRVRARIRLGGFTGPFAVRSVVSCVLGPTWMKAAGGDGPDNPTMLDTFGDGGFALSSTHQRPSHSSTYQLIVGPGEPGEFRETFDYTEMSYFGRFRADGTVVHVGTAGPSGGLAQLLPVAALASGNLLFYDGFVVIRTPSNGNVAAFAAPFPVRSAVAISGDSYLLAGTTCAGTTCNGAVARYDGNTAQAWSRTMLSAATAGFTVAEVIALGDGTALVSGNVAATSTFGPGTPNQTTVTVSAATPYLARYAGNGDFLGVQTFAATHLRIGGKADHAMVCGSGGTSAITLPTTSGAPVVVPARHLFIARYTGAGALAWVRTVSGPDQFIECNGIAASATTIAVASKTCKQGVTLAPGTLDATSFDPGDGDCTGWVARYGVDGGFQGVQLLMAASGSEAFGYDIQDVGVTVDGGILVLGSFEEVLFLDGERLLPVTSDPSSDDLYVVRIDPE